MVFVCKKLLVLVWKCCLLRRRNWLLTLFDLVVPVGVIFIVYSSLNSAMYGKASSKQADRGTVTYEEPNTTFPKPSDNIEIAYCPSNSITKNIMEIFRDSFSGGIFIYPVTKQNEPDLKSWLYSKVKRSKKDRNAFGVVFVEQNKANNFKYKLRHMLRLDTKNIIQENVGQDDPYVSSNFLETQLFIDNALMKSINMRIESGLIGQFPRVAANELFKAFEEMYNLMAFAYVFLVIAIVRDVIQEKSSGIKELMAIMGLSRWMIWFQWIIYTLMVHLPVTIIATFLFTCFGSPVIQANFAIVWLLFFLFTLNCIFLLFVLTCLLNQAVIGTLLSVGAWCTIHMVAMHYLNPRTYSFIFQILFCLLPLNNLIWVLHTINSFNEKGIQWTLKHLFTIGSTGSYISVGLSLTIFILETLLLIIILIFLDGVKPGPYGVSKPITFMCAWCTGFLRRGFNDSDFVGPSLPKTYETPPKGLNVGIEIRNLHKRYGLLNKVVAVEKVDLDLYEGEIMALLGHNGAGKTTTMSMITGMFSPTKGVIRFNGQDISKSSSYRNSLGICTQHNMYFPKLTIIEHLIFFGMVRGMSYKEAKLEGRKQLEYLDIHKKAKSFGKDLSGGMKRRLCLAVSLIGNPKYLILDEPTSGLDPQSRRKIWDIILSMRGQRTILITTHFMEEADVLSDRIAIMDHGNIVCCGTTMFLKRIYGTGYHLHVLKIANASSYNILNKIQKHIPNPKMKLISPTQIDFTIRAESIKRFPSMFAELEDQRNILGITGMSVTCTTMEDVFLKVADKGIEGKVTPRPRVGEHRTNNWEHIKGFDLLRVRYKILLWKSLRYQFIKMISTLIILVTTSVIVWLIINNTVITKNVKANLPQLLINLDIFKGYSSVIKYDSESKHIADIATSILENHKWEVTNLPLSTNITSYIVDLYLNDYSRYSKVLLALQIINNIITIQYQNLLHLSAVAANLFANIWLRYTTSDTSSSIQVINHPLVLEQDNCGVLIVKVLIVPLFWSLGFCFILILLTMSIIPLLTEERVSGFKQQQFLAGVSPLLYWVANFTFDYVLYMCIIFIYIIIIVIMGGKVLIESGFIGLLLLVLSLYGISGIFLAYLFTFFVDGVVMSLSLYMMSNIPITIIQYGIRLMMPSTILNHIFCLNPLFSVRNAIDEIGYGINAVYFCKVCNDEESCHSSEKPLMVMGKGGPRDGILLYVLYLGLIWILYLGIILILDCGCIRKVLLILFHTKNDDGKALDDEDDDIKRECDLIRELKENNDANPSVRVEGLSKKYCLGPKAVVNVSFVVFPGECFGLLGVNGAGKTTTFKILTGEIFPNSGDSVILNHSVIMNRRNYQSCIGYCPQFDAIVNSLTGKDIITIIGRLRGIPKMNLKKEVDKWVNIMGISEHVKMQSGTYSGGTKRKLSTAMAFIGNPLVVFLDEPTSGVDPKSRRKLWTIMESRLKTGQAIVLTSHSMEECEALCTRLTIMKGGKMMCIGSPEYLKNKFSQGYTVLLKLENPTKPKIEKLKKSFIRHFPNSKVMDEHMTQIHFHILDPKVPLSHLFTVMLHMKSKYEIVEDFSVSNTSMEQLFLSFAKEKIDTK